MLCLLNSKSQLRTQNCINAENVLRDFPSQVLKGKNVMQLMDLFWKIMFCKMSVVIFYFLDRCHPCKSVQNLREDNEAVGLLSEPTGTNLNFVKAHWRIHIYNIMYILYITRIVAHLLPNHSVHTCHMCTHDWLVTILHENFGVL